MARFEDDWDRDREHEEVRRHREQARTEYERRPPDIGRSNEYGSHAGWGGQGFSQGSFGRYGSQGERLWNQSIGQGYGAGNSYGGGMSTYGEPGRPPGPGTNQAWNSRDYGSEDRDRWGSRGGYGQGSEGWNERQGDWGRDRSQEQRWRDRDRQDWNREGTSQGLGGREGGWGGYGSYDRERRNLDHGRDPSWDPGRGDEWDRDRSSSNWGSSQGWVGGQHRGWTAGQASETGRQGTHFGRGPKGWRRSDDRIRDDINERLTDHPDIDASEIEVDVNNGEVTLRGSVEDRRAKRLAEDVAESVSGVRDVQNQIRVNRGFWGAIKDTFSGDQGDENRREGQQTSAPVHTITPGPETRTSQPGATTTKK